VGSTNVDISYLRTFNPSADKVAADVELHYMLGKGNSGLSAYPTVRHPANDLNWQTNLSISFSRSRKSFVGVTIIRLSKSPNWGLVVVCISVGRFVQ
jgi:hypothetical protein